MNRLIQYTILPAMCFIIMAAPTCDGDTVPVDARREHIYRLEAVTEVFTAESLNDDNLEAFEFKAVEKLMDFADYLGLIYSRVYDAQFREQARQTIYGLFDTPENSAAAVMPDRFSGSCDEYRVVIDSVVIVHPLQRASETRYSGSMGYTEAILGIRGADTSQLCRSQKKIEIILQMDYKDFGSTSLLVWKVLLGEIKQADESIRDPFILPSPASNP